MNKKNASLILSLMLVTGCATTTFTEYRGPNILRGAGGTVRVVDGIEFWEKGIPNRACMVIGVIEDSRGDSILLPSKDGAIAKLARAKGGDAVVLYDRNSEFSRFDDFGNVHYRRNTQMIVVKYGVELQEKTKTPRGTL